MPLESQLISDRQQHTRVAISLIDVQLSSISNIIEVLVAHNSTPG